MLHHSAPQLNATVGGELHGYEYSPWSSSYTFDPGTAAYTFFTSAGGPYMIVVPESMIVWNFAMPPTVFPLTCALAPPICQ